VWIQDSACGIDENRMEYGIVSGLQERGEAAGASEGTFDFVVAGYAVVMEKPALDLTSVHAKLNRAEEHLNIVHDEITAWSNRGRYEPFFERGVKLTRISTAVLQLGPPPDLVRWSVIIGDCINNLRSALDHLMNAFTKVPYIYTPSGKRERITFIIIDDPDEFAQAMKKSFSGLCPLYTDILTRFQPFNRTHPVLPPLLSIIRDLSNADKHHLLQVAGAGIVSVEGSYSGTTGLGTKTFFVNPDPIQHNDIICLVESSEPDPNLRFEDLGARVDISIWHKLRKGSINPLEKRSPYSSLLPILIGEVRYVIDSFVGAA
jgi:hypothetical protein